MTDLRDPNQSNVRTSSRPATGTPRWVKVFGIIAIALVLFFVILHLAGAGFGPGIHGM
jgi:hypothetical protein